MNSPWFTTYNLPLQGNTRLFVLPYSGAGASVYFQWTKQLQTSPLDVIGVQLPGRENRLRETPVADLPSLLAELLPAIEPWLNKPFVLFGHSMGALIAFELCRALRAANLPLPKHLFVSAFRSPDFPNPNQELHRLPDRYIIDNIRQYGGTPEAVLDNAELMAMFLPTLRADFALHETYHYQPQAPLPCPITAFSGTQDLIVKPVYMQNWRHQTTATFEQVLYPGDHFFLHKQASSLLQKIRLGC